MNLYPATSFIRHLLSARSAAGYGVHSPFVFDFLTNVVKGKSDGHVILKVERLRQEMLADRRILRITDLGVGSSGRTGQERSIHDIASTAPLPARQASLLSRIAASLRGGNSGIILELGTSLGISTLALSLAAPERRVVTIEGCPELAGIARQNLLRHGALNAEVINMEFGAALDQLKREGRNVSLAFIDGNHRGEALGEYARSIRAAGEEMIIVADDIHLNRGMYSAWSSLATPGAGGMNGGDRQPQAVALSSASPGLAPATIETFRFGILLCFRSLTPGRYRIRY
jgi:predicted O-methyltransferase YrrM